MSEAQYQFILRENFNSSFFSSTFLFEGLAYTLKPVNCLPYDCFPCFYHSQYRDLKRTYNNLRIGVVSWGLQQFVNKNLYGVEVFGCCNYQQGSLFFLDIGYFVDCVNLKWFFFIVDDCFRLF